MEKPTAGFSFLCLTAQTIPASHSEFFILRRNLYNLRRETKKLRRETYNSRRKLKNSAFGIRHLPWRGKKNLTGNVPELLQWPSLVFELTAPCLAIAYNTAQL